MDLDAVRELKGRLLADLRSALTEEDVTVSAFAVGIAPRSAGNYALAVRLTDDADAARVLGRLADRAGDELDVRTIGQVRALSAGGGPGGDPGGGPDGDPGGGPDVGDLQIRQRPLYPGVSVGHPDVTAGTLGGFVRYGEALQVLSNSHVLANSGQAQRGDAALQPGVADGGSDPRDRVGTLTTFVELSSTTPNLVDTAIAAVDDAIEVDPGRYPGGPLPTVASEPPGDALVQKVGRTTGLTSGRVTAFEVDGLRVQYDVGVRSFDNQIEIEGSSGPFSSGGDSGSVIWASRDRAALGLLFAGSSTGGQGGHGLTYANPLHVVLSELGATWAGSAAPR